MQAFLSISAGDRSLFMARNLIQDVHMNHGFLDRKGQKNWPPDGSCPKAAITETWKQERSIQFGLPYFIPSNRDVTKTSEHLEEAADFRMWSYWKGLWWKCCFKNLHKKDLCVHFSPLKSQRQQTKLNAPSNYAIFNRLAGYLSLHALSALIIFGKTYATLKTHRIWPHRIFTPYEPRARRIGFAVTLFALSGMPVPG
jgi:hypothetical protein